MARSGRVLGARHSLILSAIAVATAIALDLALASPAKAPAGAFALLGRVHPLAVHMPVGLLVLAALAEAMSFVPAWRTRSDAVLSVALPSALAFGLVAFATGLVLARGGGHPAHLLVLHRRLMLVTVIGTAGATAAFFAHGEGKLPRAVLRAAVAATMGALAVGAHFGGSMTHGEDWLVEVAPPFVKRLLGASPVPEVPAAPVAKGPARDPLLFADAVLPILKERCAGCHGPKKTKGGLRVDGLEALTHGGEHGPAIEPGHAERSLLVARMAKPTSDDEHMPPDGEPQPTQAERELIALWIDRGASAELHVRDLLVPDGARGLLERLATGAGANAAPPEPSAHAIEEAKPDPTPSAAATASAPPAEGSERTVYRDVVAPMLARRCGRCHGAERHKGGLRTDSIAALLAGGKDGAAIVPGAPDRGTLLARVRRPLDDDHHMPPSDEPQLERDEIRVLELWIARGATATLPLSSVPPELRHAPRSTPRAPAAEPASSSPPPPPSPPAPADAVAATSADPSFAGVIEPMLKARCAACHSGNDPDGDFSLDDPRALFVGGRVVPGEPEASAIVKRTTSPIDDDDHMPPPPSPQLTASEIEALRAWIAHGAKLDARPGEASAPVAAGPTQAPAAASRTSPSVPVVHGRGCGGCATGGVSGGGRAGALAAVLMAIAVVRRRRRPR